MTWQARFILYKFYFSRALSYAGLLNSFLLIYLVLDKWKLGILAVTILFIVAIISAFVLGYLDSKCGLAKEDYDLQRRLMGIKKEDKNG